MRLSKALENSCPMSDLKMVCALDNLKTFPKPQLHRLGVEIEVKALSVGHLYSTTSRRNSSVALLTHTSEITVK